MNRSVRGSPGSGSSSSGHDSNQIEELQEIWKNIRKAKVQQSQLEESGKSASSVKEAIRAEEQKNLETRLHITEKQLSKARQNTTLLMKKLSEAEACIQRMEIQLRVKSAHDIRNPAVQYEQMLRSYQIGLEKSEAQLAQKDKDIDRLNLKINSLEYQLKNIGREKQQLINSTMQASQRAQLAQKTINQMYLNEHSKGVQLLQVQQYKTVVDRLIVLLKNSSQYSKLAQFFEDAEDLHFLKNIGKRIKHHQIPVSFKRLCNCAEVKVDEKLLWTPQACYKVLLDMKLKYNELNEACIQQTLFELNKIWNGHLQNQLTRIAQNYDSELSRIRKKHQEKYDELVARKQIQRLKKQVQQMKLNNKLTKNPSETLQLLKNIGQYQDQLKIKQKQIKLLQQRIKILQSQAQNYDRTVYLEGALWVIDKVLIQIQRNISDFADFQTEFRQKLGNNSNNNNSINGNNNNSINGNNNNNPSLQNWQTSFKQLVQTFNEFNQNLVERLQAMKQTTMKKLTSHLSK